MPYTPEGVTKDAIRELLDSYGPELYYLMPVQQGYGTRLVDFYICYRGLFIAVEAKRKGSRAKKFQQRILEEVQNANGEALCVDSADELEKLLNYIKGHVIRLVANADLKKELHHENIPVKCPHCLTVYCAGCWVNCPKCNDPQLRNDPTHVARHAAQSPDLPPA